MGGSKLDRRRATTGRDLTWNQFWVGLCCAVGLALALAARAENIGECISPPKPQLPDGASATRQDMLDGQAAVKRFQKKNMQYMHCVQVHIDRTRMQAAQSLDAATRAMALTTHSSANDAFNAAVSAEEEVAGDFNIELREFNALQARSKEERR
ncbi:MAG: hypothetical protein AAGI88_04210 [Pseudomonadota bacterium]